MYKISVYCQDCERIIEKKEDVKESDVPSIVKKILSDDMVGAHNVHLQINIVNKSGRKLC